MKQLIRLNERELKRLVSESVKGVLNEVKYQGHDLHGNDWQSWLKLASLRDKNCGKYLSMADNCPNDDEIEHL